MRTQKLCIVLGACLSMASAAVAQTSHGGWNPTPLTPQQEAVNAQVGKLNQSATSAMTLGKYAEAEANARKAVSLEQDPAGQELLAAALNMQGKEKEATSEYKKIADAGGDQPRNLLPYALLLLKDGQYAEAAIAYNKAISIYDARDLANVRGEFSPDVVQTLELETACHIELGRLWTGQSVFFGGNPSDSKALDEFQKALQLSPKNALANYYKGDVLKRLGYKAQARDAYATAAKFGDGDVRKAAEDALAGR